MTIPTMKARAAAVLLAGTMIAVPAACGGEDDAASDTSTTDAPGATVDDEGSAGGETVEIAMVDYGFEGVPDEVPAGTRLTVVNESDVELHEVVAIRLPDDEERSADELMQLPESELMGLMGGEPDAVLLAMPGSSDVIPAVGDGVLSEPGRYLLACFIPTGADPDEYMAAAVESDGPPEVEGGPPHFVQGMYAELRVT